MKALFDKTFFRFLCGFIGVLSFSMVLFAVTELYQYRSTPGSQASVFASFE